MYQDGVMPTTEWFEKIKAYVIFKYKTVVDFGCAEGIMCKLAKEAGAYNVIGVDEQEHFIPSEGVQFMHKKITEVEFRNYGIGIFSMIIHWIGKEEFIKHANNGKHIIVIFREKNDGYQIPTNGVWFPTQEELDKNLPLFNKVHDDCIFEQDSGKKIRLAIYERKKHDRKKR